MHLQSPLPHAQLLNVGQNNPSTTDTTSSNVPIATVAVGAALGLVNEDERGLLMAERKIRTRAVVRADARCADHCERVCLFELVGIERWRDGER